MSRNIYFAWKKLSQLCRGVLRTAAGKDQGRDPKGPYQVDLAVALVMENNLSVDFYRYWQRGWTA